MDGQQGGKWRMLWGIFTSFLRIGPMTFGGGYAMLPLIEREIVTRRKWASTEDIADVFAVSGSIPGSIAVNTATFVGYRLAGTSGAVAALLGVSLPPFLIMLLLSVFFLQVKDHPKISAAMTGIAPAIVALIIYAAYKIGKTALLDRTTGVLIVATVLVLLFTAIHPVLVIIIGGVLGILLVKIRKRLGWHTRLESTEMKYKYKDYYIGDGI